jgi:hypothetical protein
MLAYNPGGREPVTGNAAQDAKRSEGMLFWLAWVSHNTTSMFSTSDAHGPFRRFFILATCTTFQQLLLESGAPGVLADALNLKDLLADSDLCPPT